MREPFRELPETTSKLWGCERNIVTNREYTGKILDINPGYISSIHMHEKKLETFYVREGVVVLSFYSTVSELSTDLHMEEYTLTPGMAMTVPRGQYHSFRALVTAEVFEFSTPHSDDDVFRVKGSRAY